MAVCHRNVDSLDSDPNPNSFSELNRGPNPKATGRKDAKIMFDATKGIAGKVRVRARIGATRARVKLRVAAKVG